MEQERGSKEPKVEALGPTPVKTPCPPDVMAMQAQIEHLTAEMSNLRLELEVLSDSFEFHFNLEVELLVGDDFRSKVPHPPMRPVPLIVRTLGEEIWVSALGAHGQGRTVEEAKLNFWTVLMEDYQFLVEHEAALDFYRSKRLQRIKRVLRED